MKIKMRIAIAKNSSAIRLKSKFHIPKESIAVEMTLGMIRLIQSLVRVNIISRDISSAYGLSALSILFFISAISYDPSILH